MKEFIVLMAYLTAIIALSIDAMLPALGVMGADLHVVRQNDIQLVIGFIFIGMTLGQLFYGPLADAIGRKKSLYFGLGIYIAGSAICWVAPSLRIMLIGRFLQGIGASAPRIGTMAIIRDKYQGREMAQIFSLVMGIFILVPCIAPTLGQIIIHLAGWRSIFAFYIFCAVVGLIWAHFRLEETLTPEKRRPLDIGHIISGFKQAATTPVTLGYTIASGLSFSALIGYLSCSQQIFQGLFETGDMFALYFGVLAGAIGAAFFTNSALVQKYGMRRITRIALCAQVMCAGVFFLYLLFAPPTLLLFMIFGTVTFFCLGLTFGNMGTMAMEPMGHMAGLASAFIGSVSSAISVVLGTAISQTYDGSIFPLVTGFLCLGAGALMAMTVTERFYKH